MSRPHLLLAIYILSPFATVGAGCLIAWAIDLLAWNAGRAWGAL